MMSRAGTLRFFEAFLRGETPANPGGLIGRVGHRRTLVKLGAESDTRFLHVVAAGWREYPLR